MSPLARTLALALAAVALGAVAVRLVTGAGDAAVAIRLAGAAVAALAAVRLLERIPYGVRGGPGPEDPFEVTWRRGVEVSRVPDPPERRSLRRLVHLAQGTAGDAHERLRPLLREVADARLDATFATHVDRDPLAADRLGAAWEWVRPDRPQPGDRFAPGPGAGEIEAVVTALEGVDAAGVERR